MARVVVAVPTLNEAAGIEACLAGLMDGPGMNAVPVVVADGGSTDGTREIVARLTERWPTLRLLPNPRKRQAAAVNEVAIAYPDAEVIVRCDAHAAYPPGYVDGVVRAMKTRGAQGLAAPMDADTRPGAGAFARANAAAVDTKLGSGGSAHRGGTRSGWVDHGHHAGLDAAWFRRLGGYDEGLIANEDAEYDTRLARAGGRVWLEASLRIRYFVRESPGALWRQYHAYGRGRAAHVRQHGGRLRMRQVAPGAHVAILAVSLVAAPVWPWTLSYAASYAAVLLGASVWFAATRRDAGLLLAGAALGIMHLAWGSGFLRGLVQ